MESSTSQPATGRTDGQLIAAYQSGDEGAFVELVERYHLELFHFLARFLNNRAAAEDVFQDTFLQIHLSVDSFDTGRSFKPWLFTIAANKARDYLRRVRKPAGALALPLEVETEKGGGLIDLMDADLPLPENVAHDNETASRVRQVVGSLPDHLREILLLAYFEQIPYKDIAAELGIPLGTVKSRLHAAVGSFAAAWKAQHSEVDAEPTDRKKRRTSGDGSNKPASE